MVQPVYQMKLSPFPPGQRTKKRVIQQLNISPKPRLATSDDFIQLADFRAELMHNLSLRQTARLRERWRFSALGNVSQTCHYPRSPTLAPGRGRNQRLALLHHSLKSLHRSGISQKQM